MTGLPLTRQCNTINFVSLVCSFELFVYFVSYWYLFRISSTAGKRQVKASSLPVGLVCDLTSLSRPPHSAPSSRTSRQDDLTLPRVSTTSMPKDSQYLELFKLQKEKQRLEIQVLELEAQAKARSLSSPSSVKPAAIPSLDTVRSGHNAVKT